MKDHLIDFGLPALILVLLTLCLLLGHDGEIKSLYAAVIGWIIHGGVSRYRQGGQQNGTTTNNPQNPTPGAT